MDRQYCKKCSKCRERTVVLAPIQYSFQVHNDGREYAISIPDLVVPQCSKCGNFSFDYEADCAISAAIYRQVDLLKPDEIRTRREALGLTQEQLADKLRIASTTLSRMETGTQFQQRSLDLLMRLYFKNPELWRDFDDGAPPMPAVGPMQVSAL